MLADGMVHLREHDSSGAPHVISSLWRWTGEYLILVTS